MQEGQAVAASAVLYHYCDTYNGHLYVLAPLGNLLCYHGVRGTLPTLAATRPLVHLRPFGLVQKITGRGGALLSARPFGRAAPSAPASLWRAHQGAPPLSALSKPGPAERRLTMAFLALRVATSFVRSSR